jgi:hypothetical protein
MFMALVHAANAELRSGRVAEEDAHGAPVATVLGAVSDDGPIRPTDGAPSRSAARITTST